MGVMVLPPLSVGGPGFNEFVSGPYRLGGNAPVSGTSPTVPPPRHSAQQPCARREGSWIGPLWSRPNSPRPSLESPSPAARVSAGTGGCADLFTARVIGDRGVNIVEGGAQSSTRCVEHFRTPLVPLFVNDSRFTTSKQTRFGTPLMGLTAPASAYR